MNSDRKAFFALEAKLLAEYYGQCGVATRPATLDEYLQRVVTPTLERHKQGGAVAEKFEMAYLRPLSVGSPSKSDAERAWRAVGGERQRLPDAAGFPFPPYCSRVRPAGHGHPYSHWGRRGRILRQCGRAIRVCWSRCFNDPALRKTTFVMLHGGWPYTRLVAPLLVKPNAYVDISVQGLMLPASDIAQTLRTWLEMVPEKVLFGTDAYPFAPAANMGWEETAYVSSRTVRLALGMALTEMVQDGSVTRERASRDRQAGAA